MKKPSINQPFSNLRHSSNYCHALIKFGKLKRKGVRENAVVLANQQIERTVFLFQLFKVKTQTPFKNDLFLPFHISCIVEASLVFDNN